MKNARSKIPAPRQITCLFLAFAPVIIISSLWYSYADSVKMLNAFGRYLTSDALFKWNLGTLQQRLDPEVLKLIFWDRILKDNATGIIGVILCFRS